MSWFLFTLYQHPGFPGEPSFFILEYILIGDRIQDLVVSTTDDKLTLIFHPNGNSNVHFLPV